MVLWIRIFLIVCDKLSIHFLILHRPTCIHMYMQTPVLDSCCTCITYKFFLYKLYDINNITHYLIIPILTHRYMAHSLSRYYRSIHGIVYIRRHVDYNLYRYNKVPNGFATHVEEITNKTLKWNLISILAL